MREMVKCSNCDGTGWDWDLEYCHRCDGDGCCYCLDGFERVRVPCSYCDGQGGWEILVEDTATDKVRP